MRLEAIYHVQVYVPGSRRDLWLSLDSDTPFFAIHVGDLLDCSDWQGPKLARTIRVIGLEHYLLPNGDGTVQHHALKVFTDWSKGRG